MSTTTFSCISGNGSLIDGLNYSYAGNQVQGISGGSGNCSYDSNGNMTV